MARRDIKIIEIKATNKDNNVMRITLQVGKETVYIQRDCTSCDVYTHISEYIKSNSLQVTRRFEEYEDGTNYPCDSDRISKQLAKLTNWQNTGYEHKPLRDYVWMITE